MSATAPRNTRRPHPHTRASPHALCLDRDGAADVILIGLTDPLGPSALRRAAHVTRFETWVQRITGVPMEPRAALAAYDAESGRYTVYAGNGGAVRLCSHARHCPIHPANKGAMPMASAISPN